MTAHDPSQALARVCLEALGARTASFAIGLDSTTSLHALAAGQAPGDNGVADRLAALADGIARLHGDWGDNGTVTCLAGRCPILDDRAAITALRDGDISGFNAAVDYYVRSWHLGQGG